MDNINEIKATAKAGTRLYETENAKRRFDVLPKETEGWISNTQNIESKRFLFHYPLFLSEGEDHKEAYVNLSDLTVGDPLVEDKPENMSEEYKKSLLTEEEEKIYHNNIKKESTPIGGSYFDEPMEEKVPVSFVKKTIRLKPGVTYDYNNQKIGHLPNDYYLEVNDSLAIIRNKSNNQTYKVRRSNIIGY